MNLIIAHASVKDWADLLHAIAWPVVALVAMYLFRKSISDSVQDILGRIPWERTTSLRASGLGEIQLTKKTEQKLAASIKIPPGLEPVRESETKHE